MRSASRRDTVKPARRAVASGKAVVSFFPSIGFARPSFYRVHPPIVACEYGWLRGGNGTGPPQRQWAKPLPIIRGPTPFALRMGKKILGREAGKIEPHPLGQ